MKFSFPPVVLSLGLLAPLVSVGIAGCGGGGGGSGPRPNPTATPSATPLAGGCNTRSYEPNYASNIEDLQRWRGFPLRVYLEETDARTRALTIRGFNQWVTATDNRARYTIVDMEEGADITVKFGLKRPGSSQLGVTTVYYYEGQSTIEKAEIEFFYFPFDSRGDAEETNQTVAAHEFGHALGIGGHSPHEEDLMFPTAVGGLEQVTTRDLNTVRTAYCDNFPTRNAGSARSQQGGRLLKRVIVN